MKTKITFVFLLATLLISSTPAIAEAKDIKGAKDYFLHGDKNAKVKFVTYTDFECPYCNMFHPTLEKLIEKYKKADISFSYRMFPITQIHPEAFNAAVAMECLNKVKSKKSNLELSSIIFDQLHGDNRSLNLEEIAGLSKVNENKFLRCVDDARVRNSVETTIGRYMQIAEKDVNFGTPYSVITKGSTAIPIPGAQRFDIVDEIVAEFLNKNNLEFGYIEESRKIGNDAAIKAMISNMRADAEVYYDDHNQSYKGVCSELKNTAKEYRQNFKISCKDSFEKYAVESKMSTGEYFCADSTGNATTLKRSKGRNSLVCKK